MYNEQTDMIQYVDTLKEEPNKWSICNVSETLQKLNELHEDNQLLHKMNAEAIDFMYDNFDMNRMFTDRDLNDICNEQGWELSEKGIKIDQLEKENEQLKSLCKTLIKHIEKKSIAFIIDDEIKELSWND